MSYILFQESFGACSISGYLSKNLLIICEVALLEKQYNIFSILVDQFYDTIAISKSMENNLSITMEIIKKCEINLLEMATAYNTFANEGYKNDLYFINKVEDMYGNVLYEKKELLGLQFIRYC